MTVARRSRAARLAFTNSAFDGSGTVLPSGVVIETSSRVIFWFGRSRSVVPTSRTIHGSPTDSFAVR